MSEAIIYRSVYPGGLERYRIAGNWYLEIRVCRGKFSVCSEAEGWGHILRYEGNRS
jgi:hypothetical protein